jgi:hypothetical protein
MAKNFYAGDKQPFVLYVQDAQGVPKDVTGWTAKFRFEQGDGIGKEKNLSPVDPANPKGGKFAYTTTAAEMVAGIMWWEWTVLDTSGAEVTGPYPRRSREVVARIAVP